MSGSIYHRVPKPPALRRDHPHIGAMPVPWVTCYSSEEHLVDRTSPLGLAVGCRCEFGTGVPALGKQCQPRQRLAMTRRLCSVCGTPIRGLALFPGVTIGELPGVQERIAYSNEAPAHERCLAYAAFACPKLREGAAKCLVLPVHGDVPLLDEWHLLKAGDSRGKRFMPHDTPRPPALSFGHRPVLNYVYARLDLPGQRATFLDDWMRRTAPPPYRRLWAELAADEPIP